MILLKQNLFWVIAAILTLLSFLLPAYLGSKNLFVPGTSALGKDNTPPTAAQFSTNIPSQTTKSSVTLVGKAEAGSILKIFVNDQLVKEININETTNFTTDVSLFPGDNFIWTKVVDRSGNESDSSGARKITVIR